MSTKSNGQVAYEAYVEDRKRNGARELFFEWAMLHPGIRRGWDAAGDAVAEAGRR